MIARSSVLPSSRFLTPDVSIPGGRLFLGLAPIAVLEMGNLDKAGYETVLRKIDELVIAPRRPYVIVTDTRSLTSIPGADVRKMLSEWMEKNAKGHTSLGSVTIIKSSVVRGALTALYWLFEPPSPQGIASDWREAHAWAVKKFDEANVPLTQIVRNATSQPYDGALAAVALR